MKSSLNQTVFAMSTILYYIDCSMTMSTMTPMTIMLLVPKSQMPMLTTVISEDRSLYRASCDPKLKWTRQRKKRRKKRMFKKSRGISLLPTRLSCVNKRNRGEWPGEGTDHQAHRGMSLVQPMIPCMVHSFFTNHSSLLSRRTSRTGPGERHHHRP